MSKDDPYGGLRPFHCAALMRDDGRVRVLCQAPGKRAAPARWRWTMRTNFGKGDGRFGIPWCKKCLAAAEGKP